MQSATKACCSLLVLLAVTVGGCSVPSGSCRELALRDDDPKVDAKLSAEILAAPADAVWPEVIGDYRSLRAKVRACKG